MTLGFLHRECRVDVPLSQCALADVTLPQAWASTVVVALMAYVPDCCRSAARFTGSTGVMVYECNHIARSSV